MESEKPYVSSRINITSAFPQSVIPRKRFTFPLQKRKGIVSIIYSRNQNLMSGYFVMDTVLGNTHAQTSSSNSSIILCDSGFFDLDRQVITQWSTDAFENVSFLSPSIINSGERGRQLVGMNVRAIINPDLLKSMWNKTNKVLTNIFFEMRLGRISLGESIIRERRAINHCPAIIQVEYLIV